MDARVRKLTLKYPISADEGLALVAAGLDTPGKIKKGIGKSKLPKPLKDKVSLRGAGAGVDKAALPKKVKSKV